MNESEEKQTKRMNMNEVLDDNNNINKNNKNASICHTHIYMKWSEIGIYPMYTKPIKNKIKYIRDHSYF